MYFCTNKIIGWQVERGEYSSPCNLLSHHILNFELWTFILEIIKNLLEKEEKQTLEAEYKSCFLAKFVLSS